MSQRFAVFDIDGTIFRWQLYHELFDEFYRREIITPNAAAPVFAAREKWQHRKGSYRAYEDALSSVLEENIVGVPLKTVEDAAEAIIASNGDRIYRYTTDLIATLRKKDYLILAISGSQEQLVKRFATLHNIDVSYGSRFIVEDGIIIKRESALYGHKAEILRELVSKHGLDWTDSYAIGDTQSDADMLRLVEHPIAFNPDRGLYDIAHKEGWPIVVERKDIIYELTHDGKSFILA